MQNFKIFPAETGLDPCFGAIPPHLCGIMQFQVHISYIGSVVNHKDHRIRQTVTE